MLGDLSLGRIPITNTLDIVTQFTASASGEIATSKLMFLFDPEVGGREFHKGVPADLGCHPHVHLTHLTAEAPGELDHDRILFPTMEMPFADSRDWAAMAEILSEAHADLVGVRVYEPDSAGVGLLDQLDRACQMAGVSAALGRIDFAVRTEITSATEAKAREL